MDLGQLLSDIRADGTLYTLARNVYAQFGVPNRRYIGAELLPDQTVEENMYREENIRYRTIIANDGSRYSPVQRKKGTLIGAVEVVLGDSDIGSEFTGKDYDSLLRIINSAPMSAAVQITNWVDMVIVRALIELAEKHRWEAIINGSYVRNGNNGFTETITFPQPTGHRANALGTWSNNTYDPFADITAMVNLLNSKGYTVNRIITRRPVISILSQNAIMRSRIGLTTLSPGVLAGVAPGFVDRAALNNILGRDGLPPIEEYNLQYRTSTGTQYFLPGNTMVFVCQTGRDVTLDLGDALQPIQHTLGYHAVGRATGEQEPGRVVRLFPYEDKPPRIDGQGWQTTMPVITEPEAIAVISNIS